MEERWNLIVICADTFRADFLGCYGNEWIRTPNLDTFAEKSVIFKEAYAEGLPTIPARRVFFTGNRLFPKWRIVEHKGDPLGWQPGWHALEEEEITISEILQDNGYITGFITDVYHLFKPTGNFHRGFDSWEFIRGQEADPYVTGPRDTVDPARYLKTFKRERRIHPLEQYLLNVRERKKEEEYFVARVMNKACKWLSDNIGNKPFFLWVDCFDPHEPWDPPREYADIYNKGYGGVEYIVSPGFEVPNPPEHLSFAPGGSVDYYSEDEVRRIRALYAGEVTLVDKWVGKLFEKIDELGLWNNTVVVFTSDHGTLLGEKGLIHKRAYELIKPETRIPLVIWTPNGEKGEITAYVQSYDLTPTLLALLNVEKRPAMDGRNMWKLVEGEAESLHEYVITAYCSYLSIRNREWNYIVTYRTKNVPRVIGGRYLEPRLYKLDDDPQEEVNVASMYPHIIEKMERIKDRIIGTM
ncbi:hypothetical protein B6U74_04615 [Candidatus Bathyarchaeota archaeon ex4484_205]|nr:MAG: hypothetical protein B6U74_04615 [Candidatus Bathyarchaeota archaeon ex4484_205]